MSVKAMTWAWEQQGLSDGEKLTLMAFADHADDHGVCWPSNGRVAEKVGCKDRAVRERVGRLEAKGMLHRETRTRPNGSQTSNLVVLHMGPGPGDPPGTAAPPPRDGTPPEPSEGVGQKERKGSESQSQQQTLDGSEEKTTLSENAKIRLVFDRWNELFGSPQTTLTDKRRKRIRARLRDRKGDPQPLLDAVEGAQHDDWITGKHPRSPGHMGIDTILRDDDQVTRLMTLAKNPPTGKRSYERDPTEIKPRW